MMLASTQMLNEVCIFFDHHLFRGNRCDKVRHNYNAFHSPNYPPLGEMHGLRFVIHEHYLLPQPTGPFSVRSVLSGRVMVAAIHPGADMNTAARIVDNLLCESKLMPHKKM
uniref:60 kDa lysophospholipase n=1 Tax=Lygus hesperus TaxID=30085 RepID=A0A0A9Y7M9_LYGHE